MQTSYSIDQSAALEGMPANVAQVPGGIVTKENTTVAVPFGSFVVRGAGDNLAKLPVAALDITDVTKALGVAVAQQAIEQSASGIPQYPVKSAVPVMRKGVIWVQVEEAVAPTDPVYVRFAAGTGTRLGAFRKSADTATAALLAGAKWLSTASANGLAKLDLNI